jgi:antitoxin component of MazEF toxin-antitoxin module
MKYVYALQPYQVGSKNGKSLAIVIPAEVAKKYNIDTSTIFALKGDDDTKIVTLRTVQGAHQNG